MHQQRQLQAVGHAQFLENRRQMGLDGAFGDAQRLGDLGIGPAAGRVTGGGGLALGQQAAIPVAGVLAFLGHQAQQAADQERPIQMPPVEMTSRACASPAAGVAVAVALGARGQDLGALFVVGAGAGDQQAEAGQGLRPGGVLPGRQPRQVGVQHGQGTALVAPALQVGQPAPAGNQPALGIELASAATTDRRA